ncbi:M48 family metalloprotease [Fibrella sp. HMF5335]|uniref:M48 family metalloprotease n=1 Tax=Fibrella rubiginis TaxID=2817060 RepID=A0A939GHF5_9BACT|nr:M56 family metallopeptidase [Fibrella rubiginis]MBO0936528.1 M48 family metalloprotease [Fibrella rubiginis]
MNLTNWLTSPLAEALGWTLIHALWQGFAVVLAAALLLHLARQSKASLRYRLGMSGLLMQLLASVGTFIWYYEPRSLVAPSAASGPIFNVPVALVPVANESWLITGQAFLNAHLAEIVWMWLLGVGVFGVRLVGGWAYVQRLRTTATLPVPANLLETTARIAQKLNVSVSVQITVRVTGPLVVGVLKPVILWPVGLLAGLSMAEVEAVLAHELAHVRRHDYLFNVMQSVVEVLYFFHPALWWLSERVREEREHCCDDLALAIIGDARTLARALTRVEAWQHSQEEASNLAMAFASKRQLLLQRVRRMLGVPTRPLVSNGSLAGLTLATMLLLSVSVYAVQQTDVPKSARASAVPAPPKANRRYRVNSNTEYGMTNSGRMSYVVWKGQKLPVTRVNRLQRQLDLVMGGKLNLDAVKQPDRDILLTIIEKNVAFDAGMKALSEGMSHIDYSNIDAEARADIPGVPDAPEEQMANAPDSIPAVAGDTAQLRAVKLKMEALVNEMQAVMATRQPIADRLTKELAELASKNTPSQQQIDQFTKQQTGLVKQQVMLAKQQALLAQKLRPLALDIERLSRQNNAQANQLKKQKEKQRIQLEKQMDELGTRMGKLGSRMGDLGGKLGPLNPNLEAYQTRMAILADSISKLYEPTYALSEQLGALSEQIAKQAEEQSAEAMRVAEEAMERMNVEGIHPARAPRPPRVPRMSLPRPPRPATAPHSPVPAVDAVPAPAVAPVPAQKPVPVPKVAPAPRPPRNG